MCGIFGYIGEPVDAGSVVLAALKTLEYRGYDSWGVAVADGERIAVEKQPGKIGSRAVHLPVSDIGFGHTRWATHGGISAANAHPHLDCHGRIAVIHNGIIENFRELKASLVARGHRFASETDSEVIAHLLEEEVARFDGDLVRAMQVVVTRLEGFNAIIALDAATRQLVASKNVSPLVVGEGPRGCVIASDAMALHGHAQKIHYVEDGQLVRLTHDGCAIVDQQDLSLRSPNYVPFEADGWETGLNGYPHFMAKEMAEQPAVLEYLANEMEGPIRDLATAITESYGAFLVGCGTAAYAAHTGAYLFSRICRRHINFAAGSEFKYQEHFLTPRSLVIALSQSGETADIIEAMMSARRAGARLGALVNVPQSTLDRMVNIRVPLSAGPEQCVLSTKAYSAMVAVLLLAAHAIRGDYEMGRRAVLEAAAGLREMLLPSWQERIVGAAREIAPAEHLFVIGRGLAYPTALEAALKIKEVSYIHAEGFAGGELKHGVIALIAPGTPCVVYAPCDETRSDILSGAMELKSRGGFIIGVGPGNDPVFDIHLPTPDVGSASPLVNALPAQMLGYHAALLRGNDPDKPRNLAKSVTVK
ncbi:MAG TPA: glutamine--fructose-6-phosphate transaminase (isomerizing) [Thermomicrobiales bacterium]|nr:glutamine--fructose-6-phosphate transaminase (isomerizing) [Thermomicrobiales bacterium]